MVDSKKHLQEKIQNIEDEIKENEEIHDKAESGGGQILLIIFGFIGLLLFIIPGLICFILAGIQYHNNKNLMYQTSSKINELKRELSDLEFQLKKKR